MVFVLFLALLVGDTKKLSIKTIKVNAVRTELALTN